MQKRVRLVSCILWRIWKLRCAIVYDNFQFIPTVHINSIKMFVSEWESSRNVTHDSNQVMQEQKWSPRKENDLKVNFDVSFINENSPIGIGLILHNFAGCFMGARGETSTIINFEQGKAVAAMEAINWAKAKEVLNLRL
ncbi:uncharacterized protein LOC113287846 [Papaver somniferum]|uniref:uncharacterized protein LOC113287846 n=1 Tax=Papaver somniferum TaxID=3469 RepID=UPI000E6FD070|nr:uncharacterized protein LOC113287846 [Papaver somniferum]